MLELTLALAMVMLFSAWFASFFDRRVRLGFVPRWRRVTAGFGLLLLTVSLFELLYCFDHVGPDPLSFRLLVSLSETGLVLAMAAFLTSWFASRKTFACLLPSTLLVGGSWLLLLSRLV